MRDEDKVLDILIPLSKSHLDMLEWFGQWTPEIHRAGWAHRRTWPPGFRGVSDLGCTYPGHKDYEEAVAKQTVPPESCLKKGPSTTGYLLPFGLVEGNIVCARLTPRGRAALKFYGRACPDEFVSHAPDVFDNVSLLPVVLRGQFEVGGDHPREGSPLPDEDATWRSLLVEYMEGDYRGRHTITKATASLTISHSTGTSLNGSLRQHHRFVGISVRNNDGVCVCEFNLSVEQLADLLTSQGSVPVTMSHYNGRDGMRYAEPAAPPVDAMRRMKSRLAAGTNRSAAQIAGIMAKIEAANIGVKLKAELLLDLKVALDCGDSGHAFAVDQATEEVSQVIESLYTLAADRARLAGQGPLAISVAKETRALIEAPVEVVEVESGEDR